MVEAKAVLGLPFVAEQPQMANLGFAEVAGSSIKYSRLMLSMNKFVLRFKDDHETFLIFQNKNNFSGCLSDVTLNDEKLGIFASSVKKKFCNSSW